MGLFRAYERTDKSARTRTSTVSTGKAKPAEKSKVAVADSSPSQEATDKKVVRRGQKQGPTPTRREAEAARMERLHPTLTPRQQRRKDREAKYKAQEELWEKQERGPERTLLRDFVDTRWTIVEFSFPVMILILALMMVFIADPVVTAYIGLGLWLMFIFCIINVWVMWRSFKRVLDERVPNANRRGLLMYMINRSMMIRRFRRPAPRIARGEGF